MKKVPVALVLAVVFTVALVWWLQVATTTPAPGGSGALDASTAPAGEQDIAADSAPSGAEKRAALPELRLTIVDAVSLAPIASAGIRAAGAVERTARIDGGSPVVPCDQVGSIALAELPAADELLVVAPGYRSLVLSKPTAAGQVPLTKADRLEIDLVREDGSPCVGAQAFVAPWQQHRELASPVWAGAGVGDPRSSAPLWSGNSDGNGRIVFDTLPRGPYALRLLHEDSFPEAPEGLASRTVEVDGTARLQVTMMDLYAVCAVAPPGRRIVRHSFVLPVHLDMRHEILRGRELALRRLGERFPEAVTFVGRPIRRSGAEEALIGVRAMLDGNVAAEIDWPLVRIRDLTEPVVLAPDETKVFRAVSASVVGPSGTPIDMRLRWQEHTEGGRRIAPRFARTGEAILLGPGTYGIYPDAVPGWVRDQFENATITIHSTDPDTLQKTITLSEFLRMAVIRPKLPEGESFDGGALHLLVQAQGKNYGVMNWQPARGPIEILLPAGRAELRVQSPMYAAEPLAIDVAEHATPLDIELPIVKRSLDAGEATGPAVPEAGGGR